MVSFSPAVMIRQLRASVVRASHGCLLCSAVTRLATVHAHMQCTHAVTKATAMRAHAIFTTQEHFLIGEHRRETKRMQKSDVVKAAMDAKQQIMQEVQVCGSQTTARSEGMHTPA